MSAFAEQNTAQPKRIPKKGKRKAALCDAPAPDPTAPEGVPEAEPSEPTAPKSPKKPKLSAAAKAQLETQI